MRSRTRSARTPGAGARVVWPPARAHTARSAIEGLMRERGLARRFSAPAERAANRARSKPLDAQPGLGERRDLTRLPTFTIDPAGAQDFDDAISAELVGDGVRVWVHIADVSAYVEEGSPVDLEARARGTSVYAPGTVEPMLPNALSNDACSLLAGLERLAVTVELELQGAAVVRSAFYRSVIRSDERLEYERVDRIFAGEEPADEPWRTPLQAAREAAAHLARQRDRSGALVLDTAELEFRLDEQGNVAEICRREGTESHRLIEHLMIAANEAVARQLERQRVPCLYRVHERPEPARIERLVEQLASLDVPTPPLPDRLSSSQAAELVGPISKLVGTHVRRTGRGRMALSSLLLRSLRQAYYSPRNIGHAGLHSTGYCHFTSPIRRYPDLVCHRALLSTIGGPERAPRAGELAELGAWSSERERHAMEIERDADDVAACFALERMLYEGGLEQSFAGEVVGLISAGAFVAFGDAEVGPVHEGLLPVRRMHALAGTGARAAAGASTAPVGDWWELNELGTVLRGERTGSTLRLGDPIEVVVARVDPLRGRADLLPAAGQEHAGKTGAGSAKRSASSGKARAGSGKGSASHGKARAGSGKGSASHGKARAGSGKGSGRAGKAHGKDARGRGG